MRGKLIWKSLKTDRVSIAKLRLGDFTRKNAAAPAAVARGKITFADALQTYRERLKDDHSLKEATRDVDDIHLFAVVHREIRLDGRRERGKRLAVMRLFFLGHRRRSLGSGPTLAGYFNRTQIR